MNSKLFSKPYKTKEEAQDAYEFELFRPAMVFETPIGFVYAEIYANVYDNVAEVARDVEKLLRYKWVSTCDPLLGIWKSVDAYLDRVNAAG